MSERPPSLIGTKSEKRGAAIAKKLEKKSKPKPTLEKETVKILKKAKPLVEKLQKEKEARDSKFNTEESERITELLGQKLVPEEAADRLKKLEDDQEAQNAANAAEIESNIAHLELQLADEERKEHVRKLEEDREKAEEKGPEETSPEQWEAAGKEMIAKEREKNPPQETTPEQWAESAHELAAERNKVGDKAFSRETEKVTDSVWQRGLERQPQRHRIGDLMATPHIFHRIFSPDKAFSKTIKVAEEDRLHGLSGILEKKLTEVGILTPETSPFRKNHIISSLEEVLERLSPQKLNKLGFSNGTTRLLRAGDKLKLSLLNKEIERYK